MDEWYGIFVLLLITQYQFSNELDECIELCLGHESQGTQPDFLLAKSWMHHWTTGTALFFSRNFLGFLRYGLRQYSSHPPPS